MSVMFSIIVPVYNVQPYLAACLDSIQSQTYLDWECICVDDGSTDGCCMILDKYAQKDKRFKVIHKANAGVASARNTALEMVSGVWFLFVDADDVVSPFLLSACNKVINRVKSVDVVTFGVKAFKENENCSFNEFDAHVKSSTIDLLSDFDICQTSFCAYNRAYRRERFGHLREMPLRVGEDILFASQVYLSAQQEVRMDAYFYGYRLRKGSIIHSKMTVTKIISALQCVIKVNDAIIIAGKYAAKNTRKWIGRSLLDDFVSNVSKCSVDDYRIAQSYWRRNVLNRSDRLLLLPFDRMRMGMVRIVPFAMMQWIVCCSPHKIKKMLRHDR